jgi:hypothetical protein
LPRLGTLNLTSRRKFVTVAVPQPPET